MAARQPAKKQNRPKATAKVSAKKIDLSGRRELVVELRRSGDSYRDIAEKLRLNFAESGKHGVTSGYDHVQAYRDFQAALAESNRSASDSIEEMKQLDFERLDAIMAPQFEKATDGDYFAFDRVMEVLKVRAAWNGYNAPTKTANTTPDGKEAGPMKILVEYVNDTTTTAHSAPGTTTD